MGNPINSLRRPRTVAISRRKALAALGAPLAAPFLAPWALAASSTLLPRPGTGEASAQGSPAPAAPPGIRAHQTALPYAPGLNGLTLSGPSGDGAPLRLPFGPHQTIRFVNDLPHVVIPRLRGVGIIAVPINPGAFADLAWGELRAGTHLFELRGPQADKHGPENWATNAAWPVLPLIVAPPNNAAHPAAATSDEVLLIEEWPATGPSPATPRLSNQNISLSVNRLPHVEFSLPAGGTMRLRLINATPRRMLSFLLPDFAPRVIAIDGEDAEPFPPKDRQIVLAPGNRMDVLLSVPIEAQTAQAALTSVHVHDGIRARTIAQIRINAPDKLAPVPPPTGTAATPLAVGVAVPDRPNLNGAQRIELTFTPPGSGAPDAGSWRAEGKPAPASPAFTAAKSRTISLALRNDFSAPVAFHLGGHRARLLDRLDDGWKPFWLDTVAAEPNETIRLAFVAPNSGTWDIEATVLAGTATSSLPGKSGKADDGTPEPFRFLARFTVT